MLLAQSFIDHTTYNSQQNQIVVNLFAQGLGPLLLKLLDCPQMVTISLFVPLVALFNSVILIKNGCEIQGEWVGTVTQVISVLFKGRSAESIRNRLGTVIENSESSEEEDKNSVVSDNVKVII